MSVAQYEHGGVSRRDSAQSSGSAFSTPMFNTTNEKRASRQALANTVTIPTYMWAVNEPEDDDDLHAPEPRGRSGRTRVSQPFVLFSLRGWINMGLLVFLLAGLLMLFVGYPVLLHFTDPDTNKAPGFNLGGINGSGQIPDLPGLKTLIDQKTPQEAMSRVGSDGETYNLVFSDEFEEDGRTFYPGDDPYWEAQDFRKLSLIFH